MPSEEVALFDIDMNRLDQEWLRQPQVYYDYATKLVEARSAWERAKADKELVVAEQDRDIRQDPMKFGLEKITESVITNTIALQKVYIKAVDDVLNAKHQYDTLQAVVDALEHRKRALENLVDLHGQNYFSAPVTDNVQYADHAKKQRREVLARTTTKRKNK